MFPKARLACLLAAAAAMPCATAMAADLDPPIYADQAPEYAPVEVGSGWYLRGDIGYQINEEYDGERDLNGDYGVVDIDVDSDEKRWTGSLGIGYHLTDWLRSDINVGYIPGNEVDVDYDDGGNIEHGELSNDAWYVMANAYVDLGTYVGFTPYLGAGAGVLSTKHEADAHYDNGGFERDFSDDGRDYEFAYSLDAGVAYHFTDNLSADLGYQYISAPNAEYVDVTDLDHYPVREGLDFHQVRIGLRYDLW